MSYLNWLPRILRSNVTNSVKTGLPIPPQKDDIKLLKENSLLRQRLINITTLLLSPNLNSVHHLGYIGNDFYFLTEHLSVSTGIMEYRAFNYCSELAAVACFYSGNSRANSRNSYAQTDANSKESYAELFGLELEKGQPPELLTLMLNRIEQHCARQGSIMISGTLSLSDYHYETIKKLLEERNYRTAEVNRKTAVT